MPKNPSPIAFTFDPRKKGLRKVLGDLESEVMETVWKSGDVTVREVHEMVGGRKDLAYTTVMTVMSRLAEKGLLRRRKGKQNAMVYSAAMGRDEFLRDASTSILKGLMGDFGAPAMSQLVEMIGNDSDERIEELSKLIEERRRKK